MFSYVVFVAPLALLPQPHYHTTSTQKDEGYCQVSLPRKEEKNQMMNSTTH